MKTYFERFNRNIFANLLSKSSFLVVSGDVPGQNAVDPFADDGEDDESDSGSNDEDEFYG